MRDRVREVRLVSWVERAAKGEKSPILIRDKHKGCAESVADGHEWLVVAWWVVGHSGVYMCMCDWYGNVLQC